MSKVERRVEEVVAEIDFNAKHHWLGLGDVSKVRTKNPLNERLDRPVYERMVGLMQRPEYLGWAAKTLFGFQAHPFQAAILWELWVRPFPMIVATRGGSKSTLFGVYSLLRALLDPGSKVLIVSAAFRQAKGVFDVAAKFWYDSPMLRSLVAGSSGGKQGPRFEVDRCSMYLGDSSITAIPLGNGEKVRGMRATHLLLDEFKSVPIDTIENVVLGFAAVSASPLEKVKQKAYLDYLRLHGLLLPEMEEEGTKLASNQTVIGGTAYWSFNHFHDYWNKWKRFIQSEGSPEKYRRLMGHDMPPDFRSSDFSVIRLPASMLPEGFMDAKTLARAKATVSKANYEMEYEACLTPETLVVTPEGARRIDRIQVGDWVLTHKGRFRQVTWAGHRPYSGEVIRRRMYGCGIANTTTPEHPFWGGGEEWVPSGQLTGETFLPFLTETTGQTRLDLTGRVTKWNETVTGECIYAQSGRQKFTVEDIRYIRGSSKNSCQLAREMKTSPGRIWAARNGRRQPKNAIPRWVELDYDFGLVVGYYAAEGSCGAGGRGVYFSLDGHVDEPLENLIQELEGALVRVFGLKVKRYMTGTDTNCCNVTVNSRLLVDLFKSICPGVAKTKVVDPAILYSNAEFMRGFIVGYWNGDGHKSEKRSLVNANSVSLRLAAQVRTVLTFFGVPAAIRAVPPVKTPSVIRGRVCQGGRAYCVSMTGEGAARFKHIFFGQPLQEFQKGFIYTQDGRICLSPRVREVEQYTGDVYNLHVAEDESYCLLGGAVHNCFSSDSDGFFRRSLVEACVVGRPGETISHPSCSDVFFKAVMKGRPGCTYVIGADPASQIDNFALSVLECWPDHRRVVYCWTSRKSEWEKLKKKGLTHAGTFYAFCALKIRQLLRDFGPCVRLAIDTQGGGHQIVEALNDPDRLAPGERFLYPWRDPEDPKETDDMAGDHILELVNFASAQWTSFANHGLKKDFEDKVVLFPYWDPAETAVALERDKEVGRLEVNPETGEYEKLTDTLEDAVDNIDLMKDELALIVHSETGTGRERWDLPERKGESDTRERLRKDRYSALLMANAAARKLALNPDKGPFIAPTVGGAAHQIARNKGGGGAVNNPDWWVQAGGPGFRGFSVRRGR